jgi:hypothetical protein
MRAIPIREVAVSDELALRATVRRGVSAVLSWVRARAERHGVNPRVLVMLYVLSIVPFYVGIALMLWGSGVTSLSWASVRGFDLGHLELGSRMVVAGLLINRLAWAMPYLYIEMYGTNLKWYVHVGIWAWISAAIVGTLV